MKSIAGKSRWNPNTVRRTVRIAEVASDIAIFKTKSFTTEGADDKYFPCIDLSTGAVTCDCPHFRYRLAKYSPTIGDADHHCKHLERAIETLVRRGVLV